MTKRPCGSGKNAGIGLTRFLAGIGRLWRRNCDGTTTPVKLIPPLKKVSPYSTGRGKGLSPTGTCIYKIYMQPLGSCSICCFVCAVRGAMDTDVISAITRKQKKGIVEYALIPAEILVVVGGSAWLIVHAITGQ
jgi:hypothetical protein